MNLKISRVLNKITNNYPKSLVISDLLFDDIDRKELMLIIRFLDLFNVFDLQPADIALDSVITVKSSFANIFLKSLALYIEKDFKIIRSWETNATVRNLDPYLYLNQGVNLTYSLEHQRYSYYNDQTPTRRVKVSLGIIKIKQLKRKEELYLVHYDSDAQNYKFIGGRKINEDKTQEDTLIREIEEKLPVNKLVKDRDYILFPVLHNLKTTYLSSTHASVSDYSFDIFEVVLKKEIQLTPSERWITLDEIQKGETTDGIAVGKLEFYNLLNKSIKGGLKSLKVSFQSDDNILKRNKLSLSEEIKKGETKQLEFKSSARWDFRAKKVNTQLQETIAKSISGFMNLNGGKILIGVDDDKNIIGIENDLSTLKHKNLDGFTLLINQVVDGYLGVEYNELVDINYKKLEGKTICILEIRESDKPVFIKLEHNKQFYVRMGNATKKLDSEETYNYIRHHW